MDDFSFSTLNPNTYSIYPFFAVAMRCQLIANVSRLVVRYSESSLPRSTAGIYAYTSHRSGGLWSFSFFPEVWPLLGSGIAPVPGQKEILRSAASPRTYFISLGWQHPYVSLKGLPSAHSSGDNTVAEATPRRGAEKKEDLPINRMLCRTLVHATPMRVREEEGPRPLHSRRTALAAGDRDFHQQNNPKIKVMKTVFLYFILLTASRVFTNFIKWAKNIGH